MSLPDSRPSVAAIAGWGVLLAAGLAFWGASFTWGDTARSWRALLINFLFFTSLAGGLATWPAIVHASNGEWPGPLDRYAASGISFALPSLVALAALWIAAPLWVPWYQTKPHQGFWLNPTFVFARDMVALALFWLNALWYFHARSTGKGGIAAGILIVVYCLVLSLLSIDLVMALDPKWYSTLFGGYFFMSGLYIAIAAWTFIATTAPETSPDRLRDLGNLILAFSLMTTYMMFSQLLPIWYENLPDETRFVIPRKNFQPWITVSYYLLGAVYLGPLVLLLWEEPKKKRWYLGALSLFILASMWIERWWLVVPTFTKKLEVGVAEISLLAASTGILGLGVSTYSRRRDRELPEKAD